MFTPERIAFGRQIYDYFVAKGMPPHQAAAVAGNMAWESGGRTNLVNRGDNFKHSPGAPHSVGVGQWNDRSEALFAHAKSQGLNIPAGNMRDPRYVQAVIDRIPLQAQLDFAWNEMQGPERRAYGNITNSRDLRGATANAMSYHRPAGWTWNHPAGGHGYQGRYALANRILGYEGAPAPTQVAGGLPLPDSTPNLPRLPAGHHPVRTMPEGASALGARGVQPPDIPTWPTQRPQPVTAPTQVNEDWNTPGPGEAPEPGYFDNKDGHGEERFTAEAPPQPQQPEPKIPPIDIRPQPQQQAQDDAHWDRVRQQAVNNHPKVNRPEERAWNQPPPNPPPWAPFGGSFFNKMDGSGFKDGGAVKSSKDTAKYRGHPHRGDKCRDCTMFRGPHACTSVRGAISPYGWCSYFEATPTAVAQAIAKAAGKVERNPTELQKEFGNYSMGHFNWRGLEITLENPKGATRSGGPPDKKWSVKMPAAYGYIKKTLGKDGDHVDVYVGEDHKSEKVFVIDQVDAATGRFDEHKCMLSFPNQAVAIATYNKGFSDSRGPERMGAVTEKSVAEFLQWLEKGDTTKPLGKISQGKSASVPTRRVDASLDTARKYSWGR